MISMIRILAGFICFFVFVIKPIRSNLIASVANQYPLSPQDKSILLSYASQIDPCEGNILNELGDSYILSKNPIMAAITYGNAMICSPGNSLSRFKFGESLYILGYDGSDNIKDSLKLEPHNPVYKEQLEAITKPRLQSL